jgi:hypothetical protein
MVSSVQAEVARVPAITTKLAIQALEVPGLISGCLYPAGRAFLG